MSGIRRRTLLRATSAALGVTVADATGLVPAAFAGTLAGEGSRVDPHTEVVRDARLVWRRLPDGREGAPVVGNRRLAAVVHAGARGNEVDFGLSEGRLVLQLAGEVTGVDWTLDLWDAELRGTVVTTRGSVGFTALAPAGRDALLVELTSSLGEAGAWWETSRGLHRREWWEGGRRLLAVGAGAAETIDREAHRSWWHSYYRRSFVSVPDRGVQRLYWGQVYRVAATGTAGRNGLNHPFVAMAGLADDGGSWTSPREAFAIPGRGLRSGVSVNPVESWGLPDLWTTYRYRMDGHVLRDQLYPALSKVLRFYKQFLVASPDGMLHLPPTHDQIADSTYDLTMLRWAARRAADSAVILERPAEADGWRQLSERLVPYHRDEEGILLGAGVSLCHSHAWPKHLLWIHPLYEGGVDGDLARRSFDRWAAMPDSWDSRSLAAAASMAATLGVTDDAHAYLGKLSPNDETGGYDAARSLLEMLVRSRGGGDIGTVRSAGTCGTAPGGGTVLELFPAAWPDVSIAGVRTEGAFVVDASRADGRTEWIRVRSETGGLLTIRHGIDGPAAVRTANGRRAVTAREVTVQMNPGETALLAPAHAPSPDTHLRNVALTGGTGPDSSV
jgi:hypothetical protein